MTVVDSCAHHSLLFSPGLQLDVLKLLMSCAYALPHCLRCCRDCPNRQNNHRTPGRQEHPASFSPSNSLPNSSFGRRVMSMGSRFWTAFRGTFYFPINLAIILSSRIAQDKNLGDTRCSPMNATICFPQKHVSHLFSREETA